MFENKHSTEEDSNISEIHTDIDRCNTGPIFLNMLHSDTDIYTPRVRYGKSSDTKKPGFSYSELIVQAISSSEEGKLTLKDIYAWISTRFPFYTREKAGWQNSIRHNLSLNKIFYKIPKSPHSKGKGSFWSINTDFLKPSEHKIRRYTSRAPRCRNTTFIKTHFSDIENKNSLVEILDNNRTFLHPICITEPKISDKPITTVFTGDLNQLSDSLDTPNETNLYSIHENTSTNHIFKFNR
ncbi:Forkhead domain-containing protein [Hamiltosporidium magnivora]|uniref:Forkhead domain-containing protein n=1 Tax=Hamiltosporidium magnivora TaxID=148818 RepID=A0A4V2JWA6_9MICR|nr:Forkhead domain-containing protein [Hamiltosporidium magnivora]